MKSTLAATNSGVAGGQKASKSSDSPDAFNSQLFQRISAIWVTLTADTTNLTEIADIMGYRNHSAVSERLKRVRDMTAR